MNIYHELESSGPLTHYLIIKHFTDPQDCYMVSLSNVLYILYSSGLYEHCFSLNHFNDAHCFKILAQQAPKTFSFLGRFYSGSAIPIMQIKAWEYNSDPKHLLRRASLEGICTCDHLCCFIFAMSSNGQAR